MKFNIILLFALINFCSANWQKNGIWGRIDRKISAVRYITSNTSVELTFPEDYLNSNLRIRGIVQKDRLHTSNVEFLEGGINESYVKLRINPQRGGKIVSEFIFYTKNVTRRGVEKSQTTTEAIPETTTARITTTKATTTKATTTKATATRAATTKATTTKASTTTSTTSRPTTTTATTAKATTESGIELTTDSRSGETIDLATYDESSGETIDLGNDATSDSESIIGSDVNSDEFTSDEDWEIV